MGPGNVPTDQRMVELEKRIKEKLREVVKADALTF
jgi:hypothetical protein